MTNAKNIILGFKAGDDLVAGDIVYLNSDEELVKCKTAEASDAIGIVYAGAEFGKFASVIVQGLVEKAHLLVENTNSISGFNNSITFGDLLIISGKTSGTYDEGQALSAVGGAAQPNAVAGTVVGKALCVEGGSVFEDTYSTGRVMVNFLN